MLQLRDKVMNLSSLLIDDSVMPALFKPPMSSTVGWPFAIPVRRRAKAPSRLFARFERIKLI